MMNHAYRERNIKERHDKRPGDEEDVEAAGCIGCIEVVHEAQNHQAPRQHGC